MMITHTHTHTQANTNTLTHSLTHLWHTWKAPHMWTRRRRRIDVARQLFFCQLGTHSSDSWELEVPGNNVSLRGLHPPHPPHPHPSPLRPNTNKLDQLNPGNSDTHTVVSITHWTCVTSLMLSEQHGVYFGVLLELHSIFGEIHVCKTTDVVTTALHCGIFMPGVESSVCIHVMLV